MHSTTHTNGMEPKGASTCTKNDDFNATKTYFMYNDDMHSQETLKILNVLRKNRQLCDAIIQIDNNNNDLYCHQLILACNSKLFMQLFLDEELSSGYESAGSDKDDVTLYHTNHNHQSHTNGHHKKQLHQGKCMIQLSSYIKCINEYTCKALKCCINYMYTSKLEINIKDLELLENVYLIAYKLEFERIVDICSQYLIANLNEQNCLQIRSYALDAKLIQSSTQFIESQIERIHLSNEFCALPRINIEIILFKKDYSSLFNADNDTELPSPLNALLKKWLYSRLLQDDIDKSKLNGLIQQLNVLYVNDEDKLLHDCCDMDVNNEYYSDYIHDYKQSLKRSYSTSSSSSSVSSSNGTQTPTNATASTSKRVISLKITNKELNELREMTDDDLTLPQNNQIVCTHRTNDSSLLILTMVNATMVTLNVHIKILEEKSGEKSVDGDVLSGEMAHVNHHVTNGTRSPSINGDTEHIHYVLEEETSVKLAKMQSARCSHGLVGLNKQLFIIGGYDRGECLNKCEIFDLKSNRMLDFSDLNQRRGRASIVWHEKTQTIYVMGGSDGHQELDSMECFNIQEKKWNLMPLTISFLCSNVASCCDDDFIYLVGIQDKNGVQRHCLKYDVQKNEFQRIASLMHGRSQCAMISYKDMLYVFGGHDQIRCLNTCERLSLKENQWSPVESMIEPRRGFGAAYKHGNVYLVGGTNGTSSIKTMEIYNLKTNKFTIGPQLNAPRANVSITFVDNYLFAVGGFDGKSFLRTMEYLNINDLNSGWSIYQQNFE